MKWSCQQALLARKNLFIIVLHQLRTQVVRAFAAKPVRLINLPHEVTYHATRSMQLEQVHVTVNLHSLYRMVSSILTASRRTPMHGEDYDACYLPSSSIYDTVRRREDCSWWECFHTQQGDTSQHHCVLRDFLGNVQSSRHAASRVAVVVHADVRQDSIILEPIPADRAQAVLTEPQPD
jgi:hypothetical protein